ncbi:MAG: 30S ribosomal protein S20 [Alphaproteobacteria bacterium]
MAHTKQARKRIRQDADRNEKNSAQLSGIRSFVKKLETVIAAGNKADVPAAFKDAMSALHAGARKGLVSSNAAARKLSRLAARIAKMPA